ncbi:metal-dependent hydrolase [Geomicrobium sp. JCM 19039]|uniref:metal-dependent hydrolase n=1 Tax=Geomicrobium sp. JCM 19039 TaxID=1460636 RepID=UPI00045F17C1|nr:metal-dependent hydrolase [Geomicrobium sp. JCM 19039]GAK11100.1 membrane-bound metal-dependent hydrolase YdjM [Geomicrobium sp. JCM 19039]
MKAGTHLVGALALAAAYDTFAPDNWATAATSVELAVYGGAALFGGLLPDICQPNSKAGSRVSLLSTTIRRLFGHRTFTHSLIFLLIIGVVVGLIPGQFGLMLQVGIMLGMISHFLLDMLTSRGIQLFYPINQTVRFPFHTRTGSLLGEGSVWVVCVLWVSYYTLTVMGVIH